MINDITKLPKLLKRKDIVNSLGISESLYYQLVKDNQLPIVTINNRFYIDRDKLLGLFETGSLTNNLEEK